MRIGSSRCNLLLHGFEGILYLHPVFFFFPCNVKVDRRKKKWFEESKKCLSVHHEDEVMRHEAVQACKLKRTGVAEEACVSIRSLCVTECQPTPLTCSSSEPQAVCLRTAKWRWVCGCLLALLRLFVSLHLCMHCVRRCNTWMCKSVFACGGQGWV